MNPFIMLEVGETPPMSVLLSNLALVVTEVFKWVTQVATTITDTPILLLTTGFLVLGGTIGIFGRLLSKN
jgi:hypothetical protein